MNTRRTAHSNARSQHSCVGFVRAAAFAGIAQDHFQCAIEANNPQQGGEKSRPHPGEDSA